VFRLHKCHISSNQTIQSLHTKSFVFFQQEQITRHFEDWGQVWIRTSKKSQWNHGNRDKNCYFCIINGRLVAERDSWFTIEMLKIIKFYVSNEQIQHIVKIGWNDYDTMTLSAYFAVSMLAIVSNVGDCNENFRNHSTLC